MDCKPKQRMDIEKLKASFIQMYQSEPLLVRSPGRINILGEHTDYNEGFVMPAAIDKAVYIAIAKRSDQELHLYAAEFKHAHNVSLQALKPSEKGWPNYILGVVDELQKRSYHIGGFDLYIDGDVPAGAGLSSSAAVECATAFALDQLFELSVSRMDLALIGQQAEHTFAGVNCGIMDQFASVFGRKDEAVLLDCRSMTYRYVPLHMDGYQLVLINSKVKHALADSAYNKRRAQCEQGVAWIKTVYPEVNSLRDATLEMLDLLVKPNDEDVYVKCRYVVEENLRVLKAAEMLNSGEPGGLGQLMFETHEGLSKAYEVSCAELDFLVDAVRNNPDVLGARMMGGGFGGCTLNIIRSEAIAGLTQEISAAYLQEFGREPEVYIVKTDNGTATLA